MRIPWLMLTVLFAFGAVAGERVEAPPERAYSAFDEDPARRFDFWIGRWDVNLRTHQADLSFKDWIVADASIYSILDGKAILELWDSELIKGYSLRYYDPVKGKWVLWLHWPGQNTTSLSSLEGEFRHGRGVFRSGWTDGEGREIVQRYAFSDITPFSLRWDDMNSRDGGKTWSRNWRMEWHRKQVDPTWPIPDDEVPTFVDGRRCNANHYRPVEAVVGHWVAEGATLDAYRVLDGCAVMAFLEAGERKEFLMLGHIDRDRRYETQVLDQRPESVLERYFSQDSWTNGSNEAGESVSWRVSPDTLRYRRGEVELTFERRD